MTAEQRTLPQTAPNLHLGAQSRALEWRCIGPHRGGRVVAVAGDPVNPMVFYFGACAGGVWKTSDGGTYWDNVSDGFFNTAAVGAITVAPSDPNVIYVGAGETSIRGNVSHGDGVYRSTDAGRTWTNVGLAETRHIGAIRVHPHDPDHVYVAALGHAWGPNRERGVYRSRDGGGTWEQILFRSERAGAIDLSMDPHNPRILYAAFWEAQRTPYSLSSGGPGSSLYRSTDGGDSWTEITDRPGLPTGVKGKIGVAVSPAQAGRVWALVEAKDGALFRSDDGGETWQRLCEEPDLRMRAWYYMHVFADPQDPETVWVLNLQCWKSTDGGRTFSAVPTPHGDNHGLWIDPRNPQRIIEGNDGGACVSFNGGASWTTLYNQPTAQFYHVTTDTNLPYRVYGSQQDNTAISLPSLSVRGAITTTEWYEPGGGESGYIAVRPDDPNVVFAGAIGSGEGNGRLLRYDHRTGQERNITVWPEYIGMGDPATDLKYRFQWTFPIALSPHDPNVLYVAANHLLRSTDEGASWEVVSPDLTRNDPSKLGSSGGPITQDNTGAEVYCTIFAFVESPHERGVFWAGSDDGLVHLSRDGGASWSAVTPPELPEWALISVIEVSPHDPATAYVAATRYKHDDTRPYLYRTQDYGATWQAITSGIPDNEFTRVIREDPVRRGLLFAGTESGVYVSFDDGAAWQRLPGNLPVVPIYDLAIRDGDLIAATHGRSFWIMDDLTPLRELAADPDASTVCLFPPRPTMRLKVYEGWGYKPGADKGYRMAGPVVVTFRQKEDPDGTVVTSFLDAGKNPPHGVTVTYALPQAPSGEVALTFLDAQGREIRRFTSTTPLPPRDDSTAASEPPAPLTEGAEGMEGVAEGQPEPQTLRVAAEPGLNRFVWNLRYPDARKLPDDKSVEDEQLAGPVVPPGRYTVRLSVDGADYTQEFELLRDPRVAASEDDLRAQCELLLRIRDKVSATHSAIITIRDLRGQVEGWERRLAGRDGTPEIRTQARQLKTTLTAIEDALVQREAASPLQYPSRLNVKIAGLAGFVDSADAAPARQQYEVFDDLSARIDAQLARLSAVIADDVATFNAAVRAADLPAVAPPPAPDSGATA